MTPQERDLVTDLFGRLADLEREQRDPDAERLIRDGLRRAPNALYALVQSVLVQDEALKAANDHIADLEDKLAQAEAGAREQPRGFLGGRREAKWNTGDVIRGSVPQVRPADQPWGPAPNPGGDRGGYGGGGGYPPGAQVQAGSPMAAGTMGSGPMGGGMGGGGMGGAMGGGGGSSFLGTAAAVAAGAIGSSLLMGGIRSALGGHGGGSPASGALNQLSGGQSGGAGGSNELSRDAGLNDIGTSGRSSSGAQRTADAQQDLEQDADEDQDLEQDLEEDGLDDAGSDEE